MISFQSEKKTVLAIKTFCQNPRFSNLLPPVCIRPKLQYMAASFTLIAWICCLCAVSACCIVKEARVRANLL